jgi:hypothetical protein
MLHRDGNGFSQSLRSIPPEEASCGPQNGSDMKQTEAGSGDFAIDWQEAAPSWSAIVSGAIIPAVGAFAAFVLACWLISGSLSTFLVVILAAIISALCFAAY